MRRTLGPLVCTVAAALLAAGAMPAQPGAADTLRLTLAEAVQRALRENGDVRSAAAQLEAIEAQVGLARATGLPTVTVNSSYQRLLQNARAEAIGQIFNQPLTYTANARASWTIFQGGQVLFGIAGARRARQASELTLAEARATITVAVQRAYLGAIVAEALADIQKENLALVAQRLEQADQRFAAGQASRYDVLRARVERANAEPPAIAARNQRDLALLELKRLLNLPPTRTVSLASSLDMPALERTVPLTLAAQGDDDDGRRRGVLRAADLRLRAAGDAVWAARSEYLPTITVFYQRGYLAFPVTGFPPGLGELGNQFCPAGSAATRVCNNGGWFGDRNYGLQFSWPIWDGLRAKAGVDLAAAQRQLARIGAEQTALDVAADIARARAEVERARAAFTAQRAAAGEAGEVYSLASLRLSRGLGTPLDVSDAGLNLLVARSNEARAGADLWLAVADLERARGRTVPMPPVRGAAAPAVTEENP
ncbi:MAG: TolC family protein [Gemmatimonadaceae bacterium]|nr:TolC family protein [Gemmatimonadaceae bacterium]